jgi:hypothetical protein
MVPAIPDANGNSRDNKGILAAAAIDLDRFASYIPLAVETLN